MGTVVTLQLIAESQAAARQGVNRAFTDMTRWVEMLDHRRPLSPLAALNQSGTLQNPPPALREVIEEGLRLGVLTRGALDITIKPALDYYRLYQEPHPALRDLVDFQQVVVSPQGISLQRAGMGLTLDGLAKGWIVDQVAEILKDLGFINTLVEAGGDMFLAGSRGEGRPWKVGIRHPRGGILQTVVGEDQAVATSGDYLAAYDSSFQHHHILDPGRGISPCGLASASVIAGNVCQADALSTAAMVLGAEASLQVLESLPAVEGLLVTKSGLIYRTSGLPDTR